MQKNNKTLRTHLGHALLATGLFATSLTACAGDPMSTATMGKTGMDRTTATSYPTEGRLPFAIVFDAKGAPILVDAKGEPIKPTSIDFPVKTSEIRSLETMTMMEFQGSHAYLVKIGGNYYMIKLPH